MSNGRKRLKLRSDRRNEAIYSLGEVAHFMALPMTTVRLWSMGQRYGNPPRLSRPLLRIAQTTPPALSFWNLVEVYVLASIRRQHDVSMQKIRLALRYTSDELGKERPLIEEDFLTDGVNLFVEQMASLVNVSKGGQIIIRETLTNSLRRIDRDPQGLARRIYPWWKTPEDPRHIQIDPFRSFGRPVVTGTGIPTSEIADRFRAGDSISHLAKDFEIASDLIETALRWEAIAEAAA